MQRKVKQTEKSFPYRNLISRCAGVRLRFGDDRHIELCATATEATAAAAAAAAAPAAHIQPSTTEIVMNVIHFAPHFMRCGDEVAASRSPPPTTQLLHAPNGTEKSTQEIGNCIAHSARDAMQDSITWFFGCIWVGMAVWWRWWR